MKTAEDALAAAKLTIDQFEAGFIKWLDLEMLLLPGGRERSEEEYRQLLADAGFKLKRIVPTKSPLSVIEAIREN